MCFPLVVFFAQNFSLGYHTESELHMYGVTVSLKRLLACSKRSDSGERCRVKKATKSRGGLGREARVPLSPLLLPRFYFFALLFTSHRFPLSECLEQAMEANENKRRLSGFHCFVFKFRLFQRVSDQLNLLKYCGIKVNRSKEKPSRFLQVQLISVWLIRYIHCKLIKLTFFVPFTKNGIFKLTKCGLSPRFMYSTQCNTDYG